MPTWLLDWRVWLAAVAAAAALSAYVQTVRLQGCKGELTGANAQIAVLAEKLETQNAEVDRMATEGKARTAEAAKALQEAQVRSVGMRGQAEALQRALDAAKAGKGPSQLSACPAGDAVRDVRRALSGR